jgi:hypothetical protein
VHRNFGSKIIQPSTRDGTKAVDFTIHGLFLLLGDVGIYQWIKGFAKIWLNLFFLKSWVREYETDQFVP